MNILSEGFAMHLDFRIIMVFELPIQEALLGL